MPKPAGRGAGYTDRISIKIDPATKAFYEARAMSANVDGYIKLLAKFR